MPQSNVQIKQLEANEAPRPPEPSWKGLYRVGGILMTICGVGGIFVTLTDATLYKSGYPSTPEAYLQLVSQHQALASFNWSFWVFGDFLAIAPTVAMYLVLSRHSSQLANVGGTTAATLPTATIGR